MITHKILGHLSKCNLLIFCFLPYLGYLYHYDYCFILNHFIKCIFTYPTINVIIGNNILFGLVSHYMLYYGELLQLV